MKLLIADDHTLFREALVQYIERANPTSSVTLCEDLYGALDCLKKDGNFDLVVLDLRMPGMDGMAGFKTIKDQFPSVKVALMSGVAEEADVRQALNLGAVGYFPKTMSGRALLSAIQSVVDGEVFVPDGEGSEFMPSYYGDMVRSSEEGRGINAQAIPDGESIEDLNLTPREAEVLTYLADGASNKEIANALDLQIVTVKLHVRGVCRKLDANNRTQAALKARDLGVISAQQSHA